MTHSNHHHVPTCTPYPTNPPSPSAAASNDAGAMGPVSEWMPEHLWPKVKGLEVVPCFKNLGDDMIGESDDWKKWFNDEKPEQLPLPGVYGEKDDVTNQPRCSEFQTLL